MVTNTPEFTGNARYSISVVFVSLGPQGSGWSATALPWVALP
jgi:hypothetical protein